jgi:CBS domain containing-hemolysin-like protein
MGMPAVGFERVVILLLILANGVFALAEMALVSARKARLVAPVNGHRPYTGVSANRVHGCGRLKALVQF